MYLVCCEIFLNFLKFPGRCCGPNKLLVSRAMATLEVAVQCVAEMVYSLVTVHCSFYSLKQTMYYELNNTMALYLCSKLHK
jgi:hypothetical protein